MELSEIRMKIDAVDDQLLSLFLERMALSEEVAAYKNEHRLPILNKQREREILAMDTVMKLTIYGKNAPQAGEAAVDRIRELEEILEGRAPDYLVIHHMEPDHAGGVRVLADKYPDMKLVGNAKTFPMLAAFTGLDYGDRALVVKEGEELSLGEHTLAFTMAPMVHWPEVMLSFEKASGTLFSADGFGRFGDADPDSPWVDEGRRYYLNIVGKYGVQVQALLKKAAALDIKRVCPLHGPVLSGEGLALALEKYDLWSRYVPEEKGVLVAYASIHGNTARAALELAEELWKPPNPVRALTVTAIHLTPEEETYEQTNLFTAGSAPDRERQERLEAAMDGIRVAEAIAGGCWVPTASPMR